MRFKKRNLYLGFKKRNLYLGFKKRNLNGRQVMLLITAVTILTLTATVSIAILSKLAKNELPANSAMVQLERYNQRKGA